MNDSEKELYDFAYDWLQGDNSIGGADDERAVRFAEGAQDMRTGNERITHEHHA